MIKNQVSYWRHLELAPKSERPSERVCRLMLGVFERWRRKPSWLTETDTGTIFDGLAPQQRTELEKLPVAERKGLALRKLAAILTDRTISARAETFRVHPDELIVGVIPPYSVGGGKELVSYLTAEEKLRAAVNFLDERSPFGHVVPDHAVELERGLAAVLADLEERALADAAHASFYRSVRHAVTAILELADRWAARIDDEAARHHGTARQSLREAAARLRHVPRLPPRSFLEAVQSVFFVHMALHSTGEIVPLGRLDQLLWPFLKKDLDAKMISEDGAQEIVDCFVLKLDERVVLNRQHIEDHFGFADGALLGEKGGANFDQGGLTNQWMQQLTLGGVVADNAEVHTDATNPLTYMFLEAARRIPVNSPTFDLRLHANSPKELLRSAARALLSGGAHPVLLNDDHIIPALHKGSGGNVELRSAKNYACDGCYETLFAGETEFSFAVIGAMDAIEKALNQGSQLGGAGEIHLRGRKSSFRTPEASKIGDFEQFWEIMEQHLELSAMRFMSGVLRCYGEKERVSPSPMLSAFIAGCIESGRDFSGGGARYHLISPLLTGISTAADSLWVLRHLVFDRRRIGIGELVSCLRRNWNADAWAPGVHVSADRMKEIRDLVEAGPKFGHGVEEVDRLAWRLIESFTEAIRKARSHSMFAEDWRRLKARYDLAERPFELLFAPGVGTFEQYVFGGQFVGASPDGREAGAPIASDFSAAPIHSHREVIEDGEHLRKVSLSAALSSFDHPSVHKLSDGAPADLTIPEDFPEDALVAVLERFAQGRAGNLLTITAADPSTLAEASVKPDEFDLVRVRMGGWTEFFITLFPKHQAQHQRRPLYVP